MPTATLQRRRRAITITIRRGTADDLPKLGAILRVAHPAMRVPHGVDYTIQLLQFALTFPVTYLLIVEDRIGLCGYCWCEVMLTGELLLHQVFLLPGRDGRTLHDYLVTLAKENDCHAICGLTYRKGGVRGFARWGARPKAILVSKEVS